MQTYEEFKEKSNPIYKKRLTKVGLLGQGGSGSFLVSSTIKISAHERTKLRVKSC